MSETKYKRITPRTNTIFRGDNIEILRAMPDSCIDLIYIDPPFYTNRVFIENLWGDREAVQDTRIPDDLIAFRDNSEYFEKHIKSDATGLKAYLEWMRYRVTEIHRLLRPGAAFVLHIDYRAVHYLKVICDEIFGYKQFRNEVVWVRGNVKGAKAVGLQFARNHDTLLYYTKAGERHTYNRQYRAYTQEYIDNTFRHNDNDGRGAYQTQPLGTRSKQGISELKKDGRIYKTSTGTERVKYYLSEMQGIAMDDVWDDIPEVQSNSEEKTGWPTQKPLALLERIIRTTTNEGELILDCFAGCGTSMLSAHKLRRKWIGIDIAPSAIKVNLERLAKAGAKVEVIDERDLEVKLGQKGNKKSIKVA